MRVIQWVNLAQVVCDHLPLNQTTLALVNSLRNGCQMKPIKVVKGEAGLFYVRNGRHRFVAAKLLGWKEVPVKYGEARE